MMTWLQVKIPHYQVHGSFQRLTAKKAKATTEVLCCCIPVDLMSCSASNVKIIHKSTSWSVHEHTVVHV